MRRIVLLIASIVVELVLTGCLPVTSTSPLGTTATAKPDPQLTGMWKGRFGDSGSTTYVTFYPPAGGAIKIVMLAPPAAGDDGGWMVFAAQAAKLGNYQYLDAREIDDGGKPPDAKLAHVPVFYRIRGDGSLVLYLIDEAAARNSIQKGKIAGTIEPGEFGDVTITAAPAKLDDFFASDAGRALFTKPLATLARVTDN